MARKVENDMVAYVRSIAAQRQRNADWAASAVSKSESLPAEKALELKVIDLLAKDLPDLLQKIDGLQVTTGKQPKVLRTKGTPTIYVQEGFRDRVLRTISDPNIAYLLMMLGTMGIFFELINPGNIFPGVIGGISLILAFFALQTLPVNYAGLLLILLAIIFFIAEVKVSQPWFAVHRRSHLPDPGIIIAVSHGRCPTGSRLGVLVPVVIVVSGFFLAVASLAIRAYQRKPQTGEQGILGEVGRVRQPIRPEAPGKVFVHGEIWNARSDGNPGTRRDRGSGRDRSFAADRQEKGVVMVQIRMIKQELFEFRLPKIQIFLGSPQALNLFVRRIVCTL